MNQSYQKAHFLLSSSKSSVRSLVSSLRSIFIFIIVSLILPAPFSTIIMAEATSSDNLIKEAQVRRLGLSECLCEKERKLGPRLARSRHWGLHRSGAFFSNPILIVAGIVAPIALMLYLLATSFLTNAVLSCAFLLFACYLYQAFVNEFNEQYEQKHLAFETQFWGTKMALSDTDDVKFNAENLSQTKKEM